MSARLSGTHRNGGVAARELVAKGPAMISSVERTEMRSAVDIVVNLPNVRRLLIRTTAAKPAQERPPNIGQ
jgi:hypothetical protein